MCNTFKFNMLVRNLRNSGGWEPEQNFDKGAPNSGSCRE